MQVVAVGVHEIFPKSIDCHGNVPREIGKQGTGLSSALIALSYGEKIVKIGPVYPDIFDYSTKYASFLSCHTKSSQISPDFSGITRPNFTKFLHDTEASFALLMRTYR